MNKYLPTSAFYTFDPLKIDVEELIPSIEMSIEGEHDDLMKLIDRKKSFPNLKKGEKSNLDRATMLFISSLDWQEDGGGAIPLDRNNAKERIGRFPTSDGNAIKYLLKYTSQEDFESRLHELLYKLMNGLSKEDLGIEGYQKGRWIVSAQETYDGGVQEIFKNLVKILKSAERRGCGILMRKHS
jgi:hypothetical protein